MLLFLVICISVTCLTLLLTDTRYIQYMYQYLYTIQSWKQMSTHMVAMEFRMSSAASVVAVVFSQFSNYFPKCMRRYVSRRYHTSCDSKCVRYTVYRYTCSCQITCRFPNFSLVYSRKIFCLQLYKGCLREYRTQMTLYIIFIIIFCSNTQGNHVSYSHGSAFISLKSVF